MPDRTGHAMFDTYMHDLPTLVTGGAVEPAWTPDGSAFGYVDGSGDGRTAWRVDVPSGVRSPLFDVGKARDAIAAAIGETPPGRGVPFTRFSFATADEIHFEIGGVGLSLDLAGYHATRLPTPSLADTMLDTMFDRSERSRTTPRRFTQSVPFVATRVIAESRSPDGAHLLSTKDGNVVLRSTYDGSTIHLTEDGVPGHEWRVDAAPMMIAGVRTSAVCWSPSGDKIAAYKVDLRGVHRTPRVHYLKPEAEIDHQYTARAGGVLERSTLYVLDLRGRPAVELDLGDTTDTYPVHAAWLPDSSGIVVFQMSRDCRRADVYLADVSTGRVRHLFSESGESFIRIHHFVYMGHRTGLWLSPDGRHIVWESARSGWRHYYLYDLDGNLVRPLTTGDWPVEDVVAIRDGWLYFTGHRDQTRPYDTHFYRVALDGGDVEALTDAPGVHDVRLSPNGDAFLDSHSALTRPHTVELRTTEGEARGELARADISALAAIGYTPPEEFTVTAADGETTLWGALFRPHDFDPAKRYPVVECIFGGPQYAIAPHDFVWMGPYRVEVNAQAIAQLGYVTVVLDGRGTPGRSKAFHDASYLRWANVLADDHAEAIRQLARRYAFIDGDRVGIVGSVMGGYSAFRCLADRPDVYKAAVASAAGFDTNAFVHYEGYLDLPQANPDGYAFADSYRLAANIEGALMLSVGTSDTMNWTDTIKMSEALIRAGKLHDFVALPDAYLAYDSLHEAYYWRKVARFFGHHLRGETTP